MAKKQVLYTVDEDLLVEFSKLANEYSINKSLFVENAIRRWVDENNHKNKKDGGLPHNE